jgi:hypothetical protein
MRWPCRRPSACFLERHRVAVSSLSSCNTLPHLAEAVRQTAVANVAATAAAYGDEPLRRCFASSCRRHNDSGAGVL